MPAMYVDLQAQSIPTQRMINTDRPADQHSGKWAHGNFRCYEVVRWFWDCDCNQCQRDCYITEQYSSCHLSPIPHRTTDIRETLFNLHLDLQANLAGAIPIVGPLVAAAMHFRNGIFRAVLDSDNGLVNGVIDDVNERHQQLIDCMGELIDQEMVEIHVNAMKRAFVLYSIAAQVDDSD